ncbi:MAG: glycosyltransferase family 2 protein [Polyangiaceae bacterium]
MFEGKRVAVVVPAFNEAERIARTLRGIPEFVDVVVVVDDASQDDTTAVARAALRTALIVRHATNQGVGRSIVTGYRAALREGADIAVVMAGDGQMDPSDLPRLLHPIVDGRADYAKGDRMRHADVRRSMPAHRYWVARGLALLTARAAGLATLSDSQSGYTAITRQALDQLDLDALWPRYGYPNHLIGMLASRKLRIEDTIVRPVYAGEKSGLRPWHVVQILRIIARVAADRRRAAHSTRGKGTR